MANVHPNLVGSIRAISFAQNGEDIILMRAFADAPGGFYVDVGAGDPIFGSLTWNLVTLLGWSGIDIEPQPELASRLRDKHARGVVLEKVVSRTSGDVSFFRLEDNWGMSTTLKDLAVRHEAEGWSVVEERVESCTLDSVLEQYCDRPIDLLKIDVEGAELEVLQSIELRRWMPKVLVVEATEPASTRSTHEAWESMVTDENYVLTLFDGLNRFYVRSDLKQLQDRIRVPANVFDAYVPLRWWSLFSADVRAILAGSNATPPIE